MPGTIMALFLAALVGGPHAERMMPPPRPYCAMTTLDYQRLTVCDLRYTSDAFLADAAPAWRLGRCSIRMGTCMATKPHHRRVLAVRLYNHASLLQICSGWVNSIATQGICVDKMAITINSEVRRKVTR